MVSVEKANLPLKTTYHKTDEDVLNKYDLILIGESFSTQMRKVGQNK